ncbi:single-stranded-DNA-specific exonuclease RecJ [Desulfothermus okinawensis]
MYKWKISSPVESGSRNLIAQIANKLNVSQVIVQFLWKRDIRDIKEISMFLNPSLKYLPPLSSIGHLTSAAEFIVEKLKSGSKIAIWGDYDVDGITSTSILVDLLKRKGFLPTYYIPNRLTEGYGLNLKGLKKLVSEDVDLVVTVDCGISNIEEVRWLREQGVDVVVTDHHMPLDILPDANFIINPKVDSSRYKNVAGVGVAFLLAAAINNGLGEKIDIRGYLDLVALGTIADVVPLDIDNRILVKNGLLLLSENTRPGIIALKEVSGLKLGSRLRTEEVGYMLAPRINAAGRMGKGYLGVELLLTEDIGEARKFAKLLEGYNKERKREEDRILKDAISQAQEKIHNPGLVLYGEDWHEGVVGIVASRICDRFYKPTFVLTGKNGKIKGSGRSIPEVNLYLAISECKDALLKYGGHPQAGGITLATEKLDYFEKLFIKSIEKLTKGMEFIPILQVDSYLPLSYVDYRFIKELELLEPFGPNNPEPVFWTNGVKVTKQKIVAKDHVFLEIRDEKAKKTIWAKAWNMAELISEDLTNRHVKIAFYPRINTYNGLIGVDLQIKDLDVL